MERISQRQALKEVATLFLKLGCIGFGGPAVHIALMEKEVVGKRKWLSQTEFLDLVGATNLIPGPNSTEMTMHIGQERAGWKGLVVAGVCFIFPAVLITGILAWAYRRYGTLPEVAPFLYGIKPAVIAVLISLVFSLSKKAIKSFELAVLGFTAATLALIGINEVLILFGGGLTGMLIYLARTFDKRSLNTLMPLLLFQGNALDSFTWKLFITFLKIGAILYGSGYVLFAFLDAELVQNGLLSKQALTDAMAVGQFTPGPVFSSATFIGWQIAGLPGAIAATVGIFLPSFVFVTLLNPLIPALRKSRLISAFLDAVNVVSLALILAICAELATEAVADWRAVAIAVLAFIAAWKFKKLNSAFIIFGGALLGYLLWLL
jgi:chromate transporter